MPLRHYAIIDDAAIIAAITRCHFHYFDAAILLLLMMPAAMLYYYYADDADAAQDAADAILRCHFARYERDDERWCWYIIDITMLIMPPPLLMMLLRLFMPLRHDAIITPFCYAAMVADIFFRHDAIISRHYVYCLYYYYWCALCISLFFFFALLHE